MKKKLIIIISVAAVAAAVIAIYIAGIAYGQDRFYPNTFVNGVDVGRLYAEDAEPLLTPENFKITLKTRDGDVVIDLKDIDYQQTLSVSARALIKRQQLFAWPATLFKDTEMSNVLDASYSVPLLKQAVDRLSVISGDSITAPADAYIGFDENGEYKLFSEVYGNTLNRDKVIENIVKALDEGSFTVDLEETGCYLGPSVFDTDEKLLAEMEIIRGIGGEIITVDMTDAEVVLDYIALTKENLIYFDEGGELCVNEERLYDYELELEDKYDTYMKPRNFKTSKGEIIQVGAAEENGKALDTYGFWMDSAQTRNALREAILSKTTQTIKPVWVLEGNCRDPFNMDIGDTYIEISLNDQHLWFYSAGVLITECDIVTGTYSIPIRRTPAGLFGIWDRAKDTHLVGEMAGEEWDSHVDYWMGITWTAVGIHDADWRWSFGGDIYMYNGSHGCINVPDANAKILFDMTDYNSCVVIY